jgi:flagellar hook-associated protein 3 FlgL
MRVTDKMGYQQVTANMQKNRQEMSDLQTQASMQKRVTKPSDDPVASTKVLSARTDERANSQFIKNINVAKSFLEFSDQSLSEFSEVLMRLKELAIYQANDAGASADTRRVVAEEVSQAYAQLIQIGNRKLGDRYIFGGYTTTQAPFDSQGTYKGDDGDIRIHINKDAFVPMNVAGNKIFLGEGLGADGSIRSQAENPRDPKELKSYQQKQTAKVKEQKELQQESVKLRGPASLGRNEMAFKSEVEENSRGLNILKAVKDFEIGLRVNDKASIQEAIDNIDLSITQIVQGRAQVGARFQAVNHTQESLQKAVVDNKVAASQAEDSDVFQLANDIAKADSTMKATLETSGKMIQPSLLDFLK